MLPFHDERDTPEIRLMRTIVDLNHRILHTPSAEERTALRTTITVLRREARKPGSAFYFRGGEPIRAQRAAAAAQLVTP